MFHIALCFFFLVRCRGRCVCFYVGYPAIDSPWNQIILVNTNGLIRRPRFYPSGSSVSAFGKTRRSALDDARVGYWLSCPLLLFLFLFLYYSFFPVSSFSRSQYALFLVLI